MVTSDGTSQRFDAVIVLGTAISLYWSLYVQPQNGEVLALTLGILPVAYGVYRFVPPRQTVVQGLFGTLAVVLGGMAPSSVLVNSQAGRWLVGTSPLPLSLGFAIIVVLCVLVGRRAVQRAVAPADSPA